MSKLKLSQTPDFRTPVRFFLTAPLFGVAAALLLTVQGTDGLVSRWTPGALAVTHLLTLGVLSMTVTGALFQIFPVVLGIGIPGGRPLARLVHVGLSLGSALVAAGFLLPDFPVVIQLGLVALALSFGGFLAAAAAGLLSSRGEHPVLRSAHYALAGHLIVVLLGLLLGLGHAGAQDWAPDRSWTDLHAVWGLAGWLGLLVMGVAYEVVPMFQLTPPYPPLMKQWLAPAMAGALVLWSAGYVAVQLGGDGFWSDLRWTAGLLLSAGYVAFATVTLYLQSRRKGAEADVTFSYWVFGMLCLVAGIFSLVLANSGAETPKAQMWGLSASILLLIGFAVSVINGMLHKIVPFLVWLHLTILAQSQGRSRREVPNMKRILPQKPALLHFALHCLGVVLLCLMPIWNHQLLLLTAGSLLAAAFAILWWTLYSGVRVYYRSLA